MAQAITQQYGFAEVDVDCTKFELYGQTIQDDQLKPEDWARIYAETDKRIESHLLAGMTVVDASRNFSKVERDAARRIADRSRVSLITIYVDTPEEIVRQRMLANRVNPVRRDITDKDFDDVIHAMDVPVLAENALVFHYLEEINAWLLKNSALLSA